MFDQGLDENKRGEERLQWLHLEGTSPRMLPQVLYGPFFHGEKWRGEENPGTSGNWEANRRTSTYLSPEYIYISNKPIYIYSDQAESGTAQGFTNHFVAAIQQFRTAQVRSLSKGVF